MISRVCVWSMSDLYLTRHRFMFILNVGDMVTALLLNTCNLQRAVNSALSIMCSSFPSIQFIIKVHYIGKSGSIVKNACHPGYSCSTFWVKVQELVNLGRSDFIKGSSPLLSGSWTIHLSHTLFPEMLPWTLPPNSTSTSYSVIGL